MTCPLPSEKVNEAFLAAPPAIAQEIADKTVKHPSFLRDMIEYEQWPVGAGNMLEQIIYRGAMPKLERGFDKWKQHSNNTGCNPCSGPNCAYNWTQFGGHGFERKVVSLMSRDFRSPEYCVKEIQTTAHYKEVFGKIVENLYRQVDFFKEYNIAQNFLTMLAKKFVVDSDGPKINTADPYNYPTIGTARLSNLNIVMLEMFYEFLRRSADVVPFDVVDGAPIYSLMCSHQLLARLYRDDSNLRKDVHFSGLANDMLSKYNFMSTIQGMFIAAPILLPRRFNIVGGIPVEVNPYLDDIPMETGAFTGNNPAYEMATHEEVQIMGKYPAKVYYQNTENTLGENSDFGPEFGYFNSWKWINPETVEDPARRVGFYMTNASLGLSPQWSEGLISILVERPSRKLMAQFYAEPSCPPVAVECQNSIPAQGCPCPTILSVTANPITAGNYFVTLSTAVDAEVGGEVILGVSTGGYVTGTVVAVSADGLTLEVTISGTITDCIKFTTVFCSDTRSCTSDVLVVRDCGDYVVLTLRNAIKADATEEITIVYSDGTTATVVVRAVDLLTNNYTLQLTPEDICGLGGIVKVCVPATTDASCAGCGGIVLESCES